MGNMLSLRSLIPGFEFESNRLIDFFFWRRVSVPAAPVRIPSQRPLPPRVASVTSVANDKGDNEMILGAVHRSSVLQLRKTPARIPSDEGVVRPVIASKGVPFLQMKSVGSHSTSGREKEGRREGWGVHGS